MQKLKNLLEILNKLKGVLLFVSAIIVASLNLWLGIKLSPIVEDLSDLAGRVSANEDGIDSVGDNLITIKDDVIEVKEGVSRIEGWINAQ